MQKIGSLPCTNYLCALPNSEDKIHQKFVCIDRLHLVKSFWCQSQHWCFSPVVRVRNYLRDRYTKLPLHFLTDFECVAKGALYKEITNFVRLVKLVGSTLIPCLLRNIYNICSTFPNKNLHFHPLNMVL